MKPVFQGLLAMTLLGSHASLAHADVDIDQLAEIKLSWIENEDDVARVKDYAKAGNLHLSQTSGECSSTFPTSIGSTQRFCVSFDDIPSDVSETLSTMQATRFDNVSDYDLRVTRYVVARHDGSLFASLQQNGAATLASLIEIAEGFFKNLQHSRPAVGSFAWLGALRGLWVGETAVDDSPLFIHAAGLSTGDYHHVSFGPDEVSLYPGGGYNARFVFYINDQYIIYAKSEGWNS